MKNNKNAYLYLRWLNFEVAQIYGTSIAKVGKIALVFSINALIELLTILNIRK
jgi:hypothetical protein